MTVFVAGVHGVGKSFLCQRYALEFGVTHESASGLIRRERSQAKWGVDKKVGDVDDNQLALRSAVKRIAETGSELLLDGHFVLISPESEFIYLDVPVFHDLGIEGVVLLEADPELISSRLADRDSVKSVVDISEFLQAERRQAEHVCKSLGVPLRVLNAPEYENFSKVVCSIFNPAKVE